MPMGRQRKRSGFNSQMGRYFEATQLSTCLMSATGAAGWAVSRPLTVVEARNCAIHAEHASWYNATDMGTVEEVADSEGNLFLVEPSSEMIRTEQVITLRDIFGNPFRPGNLESIWRTRRCPQRRPGDLRRPRL